MHINMPSRIQSEKIPYHPSASAPTAKPSVSFLDAMKQAKTDTITVSNTPDLKKVYDQLSPASKNVLERMKSGKNDIDIKEWSAFCGELEQLGAISEEDYFYARGELQMVPLGAFNPDGSFSQYANPPLSSELRNDNRQRISGVEHWSVKQYLSDSDWSGDPFAYLSGWRSTLLSWRSELSLMKNPDGSPMYRNFSPITEQANACEKVMDIVKNLMQVK